MCCFDDSNFHINVQIDLHIYVQIGILLYFDKAAVEFSDLQKVCLCLYIERSFFALMGS